MSVPRMAEREEFLERVFPLRIEVGDNPGGQSSDPHPKEACHVCKKTKFDGPKIWGQSDFGSALPPKETTRFGDRIQHFGALIALRETDANFRTVAVSQNAEDITQLSLDELFGARCFSRHISEYLRPDFLCCLNAAADDGLRVGTTPSIDPEICVVGIVPRSGKLGQFWCTIHATIQDPSILACEIEKYIPFLQPNPPTTHIRYPSK
ncbi:hypothetical protein DL95DRAFT_518789 [Leptodontidium sp. 2 PMI_412]|nr:hypothetical protein DL95DRAFT_518789 [Leptodontidium sp. 2 PMI_412]